jgi:hypothetical protein
VGQWGVREAPKKSVKGGYAPITNREKPFFRSIVQGTGKLEGVHRIGQYKSTETQSIS